MGEGRAAQSSLQCQWVPQSSCVRRPACAVRTGLAAAPLTETLLILLLISYEFCGLKSVLPLCLLQQAVLGRGLQPVPSPLERWPAWLRLPAALGAAAGRLRGSGSSPAPCRPWSRGPGRALRPQGDPASENGLRDVSWVEVFFKACFVCLFLLFQTPVDRPLLF